MAVLQQHCEVLELRVPSGQGYVSSNKGYAFAVVSYDGETEDLVRTLDGKISIEARTLYVCPHDEWR